MQPILPAQVLVAFPFKTIIDELLGDNDKVVLKQQTAQILQLVCKNRPEFDVYIQSPFNPDNVNLYGKPIKVWFLWRLHYWRISSERDKKNKIRQDKERDDRFLFEANVKLIASRIKDNLGTDLNVATIVATGWLRKSKLGNIKFAGIKKLYENVKELPSK